MLPISHKPVPVKRSQRIKNKLLINTLCIIEDKGKEAFHQRTHTTTTS